MVALEPLATQLLGFVLMHNSLQHVALPDFPASKSTCEALPVLDQVIVFLPPVETDEEEYLSGLYVFLGDKLI